MRRRGSLEGGRLVSRTVPALLFSFACLAGAPAEGLRNITTATLDYYFDDTFRLALEDVFLARLSPEFSLQLKAARYDTNLRYQHALSLGPIINFSPNLYLDALYGLGLDSALVVEHRGDINFNYETDDILLQIGLRGAFTPATEYFYFIPSVGGKFKLADWLGFFNKIFLSWNVAGAFAGSYWGELDWILSPVFTLRTGGTIGWAEELGFSLLAGIDIHFSREVLLKYYFQFLSNTFDYSVSPERKIGIENGIFLDIRF